MTDFPYDKDADGIATIIIDMPGPVNVMNDAFSKGMTAAFAALAKEPGLTGVVLASGKRTFFAGGDVKGMSAAPAEGFNTFITEAIARGRVLMRAMEKLPVPVVAAINGAALGGGYELTLASNYRIAWDNPAVVIGLPEATLGLLPGGGGCVRMVKKFGIIKALPYLLSGRIVDAGTALSDGLIDALVPDVEDLVPQAKAWIRAQRGNPDAAVQPWDRKDYQIPGGGLANPAVRGFINFNAFRQFEETQGLLPNKTLIFDVAVEALKLDIDTALQIETRALVSCIVSPVSKNMMMANFIQKNAVRRGPARPEGMARTQMERLGVVGSGGVASALASAAQAAGIAVVRIDPDQTTGEGAVDGLSALTACDFVVEAVDGPVARKQQVVRQIFPLLGETSVLATVTSGDPVAAVTMACDDPARIVGLHLAAPDDALALVELVATPQTSDASLARGFDFVRQLRRTAIVVSDSPRFFAPRIQAALRAEAEALVESGVPARRVENLARGIGLRIGGLSDQNGADRACNHAISHDDVKDRLLFGPVIESLKCLESGVVRTVAESNIGSLLGAGAPIWTGGYTQFVNGYGLDRFVARCNALADRYGDRFRPPAIVVQRQAAGESFV